MNLYSKMKSSEQLDTHGNYYLDVLTNGFEKFTPISKVTQRTLTQQDIDRFDRFVFETYGDYYDDIILAYNFVDRKDLVPGQIINLLPSDDIQNYYNTTKN